jgi:hypothetical protein
MSLFLRIVRLFAGYSYSFKPTTVVVENTNQLVVKGNRLQVMLHNSN